MIQTKKNKKSVTKPITIKPTANTPRLNPTNWNTKEHKDAACLKLTSDVI
jgi:hypothetical protein